MGFKFADRLAGITDAMAPAAVAMPARRSTLDHLYEILKESPSAELNALSNSIPANTPAIDPRKPKISP